VIFVLDSSVVDEEVESSLRYEDGKTLKGIGTRASKSSVTNECVQEDERRDVLRGVRRVDVVEEMEK
jgi:hypothetical protein